MLAAFRWPKTARAAALAIYCLGAIAPLFLYASLNKSITGDLKPGFLHPEFRPALPPRTPTSTDYLLLDDDDNSTVLHAITRPVIRILSSLVGAHGLLSHFPILLLGILGVSMVMHRHWPYTTKILAATAVVGACSVLLAYALARTDWKDAMFANRWFLVFLPLILFWAGAWLRKSHRPSSWAMVSVLLLFSCVTALVGATDPPPKDGYDRYTAAVALMELVSPSPHHSNPQHTSVVTGQ